MTRRAWWGAVVVASGLGARAGCAYYNGMYNARRSERAALRLERQGRAAEATDQWQRAVAHAETLATRHPRSRWAVDALLLSARGHAQVRDFGSAVYAAERALRQSPSPSQRAAARRAPG